MGTFDANGSLTRVGPEEIEPLYPLSGEALVLFQRALEDGDECLRYICIQVCVSTCSLVTVDGI